MRSSVFICASPSRSYLCRIFFFFFQAEDGIRDFHVTGVQTCALPIFPSLNHTVVLNTKFPLFLTGGGEHDDNPVKLEISNGYHNSFTTVKGMKIDNI